ncbi:MAG TPA: sterol desaturase, partial [Flavobacteriaceae bacterium]|nr:sterol desaturase [Flavobacteriaceae bacterium]
IFLNAGDAPAHFYSWRTVLYCYFILSLMGLAHGFFQPKLAHTTKEISR